MVSAALSGCYDTLDPSSVGCPPRLPECAAEDYDGDGVPNGDDDFPLDENCATFSVDDCEVCGTACPVGWDCKEGLCVCAADNEGHCLCTADCAGRECGDDGCGGSCGDCPSSESCRDGLCSEACAADCAGRECGDDGCGGSCGDCSAGEACRDGLCRSETTGGSVTLLTVFGAPTASPRGLSFGAESLWVGDAGDLIYEVDPDTGAERSSLQGPADSPIDLAYADGTLYAAYSHDRVYRVAIPSGVATELTLTAGTGLVGIGWDGTSVLTWQGPVVDSRDRSTFAVTSVRTIENGTGLLAASADRVLVFGETSTADLFTYMASVFVLDGTRPSELPLLDELSAPLDASLALGLAADGDRIWVVGGGVGPNANRIVAFRWH